MTRISATEGDEGYSQFLVCRENDRWPKTLLDGVEVDNVITADDARGVVVKLVMRDGEKIPVFDCATNQFVTETLRGDVNFVWPEKTAANTR